MKTKKEPAGCAFFLLCPMPFLQPETVPMGAVLTSKESLADHSIRQYNKLHA